MEPYAPIGGADPFAASMKLVTVLVAELQAPGAAGLTAYELEQFAGVRAPSPRAAPRPRPRNGCALCAPAARGACSFIGFTGGAIARGGQAGRLIPPARPLLHAAGVLIGRSCLRYTVLVTVVVR